MNPLGTLLGYVSLPKLNKSNYSNWSIHMRALMGVQDVWEYVTFGYEEPSASEVGAMTANQLKAWKEKRMKDKTALYLLFQLVDESGSRRSVKLQHQKRHGKRWRTCINGLTESSKRGSKLYVVTMEEESMYVQRHEHGRERNEHGRKRHFGGCGRGCGRGGGKGYDHEALMAFEDDVGIDTQWYLDMAARNHMCSDKGLFLEMREVIDGSVSFGDEAKVVVTKYGTICFSHIGKQTRTEEEYHVSNLNTILEGCLQSDHNGMVKRGVKVNDADLNGRTTYELKEQLDR
ncbi:retrovirus-related pol polyprotein from transposon TNT 1-94 [Tanacetum coccineum]